MTKHDTPRNAFADLVPPTPANDLPELLNQAFDDLRCLRCKDNRFAIIDNPTEGVRSALSVGFQPNRNALSPYRHLPIVTIVCRNCGHVEQFAEDILREIVSGK